MGWLAKMVTAKSLEERSQNNVVGAALGRSISLPDSYPWVPPLPVVVYIGGVFWSPTP